MNPSAQAFIERLQRGDIRYMEDAQPDGSHYVAVEVAGKSGKLYNIAMVFSADGAEFGMRCYKLGQVPTERVRPMLKTLNALNGDFAWVRFFVDSEQEVAAALDAIITPASAPRVCWEMLVRMFSVLDEAQEKINDVLR